MTGTNPPTPSQTAGSSASPAPQASPPTVPRPPVLPRLFLLSSSGSMLSSSSSSSSSPSTPRPRVDRPALPLISSIPPAADQSPLLHPKPSSAPVTPPASQAATPSPTLPPPPSTEVGAESSAPSVSNDSTPPSDPSQPLVGRDDSMGQDKDERLVEEDETGDPPTSSPSSPSSSLAVAADAADAAELADLRAHHQPADLLVLNGPPHPLDEEDLVHSGHFCADHSEAVCDLLITASMVFDQYKLSTSRRTAQAILEQTPGVLVSVGQGKRKRAVKAWLDQLAAVHERLATGDPALFDAYAARAKRIISAAEDALPGSHFGQGEEARGETGGTDADEDAGDDGKEEKDEAMVVAEERKQTTDPSLIRLRGLHSTSAVLDGPPVDADDINAAGYTAMKNADRRFCTAVVCLFADSTAELVHLSLRDAAEAVLGWMGFLKLVQTKNGKKCWMLCLQWAEEITADWEALSETVRGRYVKRAQKLWPDLLPLALTAERAAATAGKAASKRQLQSTSSPAVAKRPRGQASSSRSSAAQPSQSKEEEGMGQLDEEEEEEEGVYKAGAKDALRRQAWAEIEQEAEKATAELRKRKGASGRE